MYRSSRTQVALGGLTGEPFLVQLGIRPGCPASGSIFVLCGEGSLCGLRHLLYPEVRPFACADDLALLLEDL